MVAQTQHRAKFDLPNRQIPILVELGFRLLENIDTIRNLLTSREK